MTEIVMIQDLRGDIEKLLEPILATDGYELVEIKLSRYKKRYRLQIFVDSDRGVILDECARLSGLIGTALDLTNYMSDGYILEVSSPGLDRPLYSDRDFMRKIGKEVRVSVMDDGREKTEQGTVVGVENGRLKLKGKSGSMDIALADIRQGKVII